MNKLGFVYLAGAIISEVFGSSMMKITAVNNSKKAIIGVAAGYVLAFYLLSLALLTLPLSFAYAAWSGVGTMLTAIIGFAIFKEEIKATTVIGIIILIIGLILMRV
ncbi:MULTISPECIES: SMR family transporter [Jeotgalicoccus]|uniref:SMR family transporter n=1 Tax=Jeotgalicoccus TaxID=227979 RepID=UPI00296E798F|nr:SMR family transporter [Jeotgalicoccus nanhaiensis]